MPSGCVRGLEEFASWIGGAHSGRPDGSAGLRSSAILLARQQLNLVWALRRVLSGLASSDGGNSAALELLKDRMNTFRTNDEFLAEVAKNRLAAG